MACLMVEIFTPGFGFFGIAGIIFLLTGMFWRIGIGHGDPIAQFFIMAFFLGIIIGGALLTMVYSAKKGRLAKSALMASDVVIEGISPATKNFVSLIGRTGTATTDLKPTGKADIDGTSYDVTADSVFIPSGTAVKVDSVEGVRIVVKKAL